MIDFNALDYNIIDITRIDSDVIQTIADTTDTKTAVLVINSFGGRSLVIASKARTALYDEMITIIGEEATEAIFSTFAGEIINIPVRRNALKLIIHQLNTTDEMILRLIHEFGITKSTIYNMIRQRPKLTIRNNQKITQRTIEDFL
jgi:plasmid maintenance system antidote protein VapI